MSARIIRGGKDKKNLFFDQCVAADVTDAAGYLTGQTCATLSFSFCTFKLGYVYFSAEWLEGDRLDGSPSFYYGEPVPYFAYDGYVEYSYGP